MSRGHVRDVTRIEVAEAIGEAFEGKPISREELIEQAQRRKVADPLIGLLRSLPNRRYRHVRDLWEDLPEVPIE